MGYTFLFEILDILPFSKVIVKKILHGKPDLQNKRNMKKMQDSILTNDCLCA